MLFEPAPRFTGLPAEGFETFGIKDRDHRRKAIIAAFHPPLKLLGEDVVEHLNPFACTPLHAHLPRLDWPHGYQPFCTWLAVSRESHGYQAGPQLNVGVHGDHVAARFAWDTQADSFGRFEFLARHGELGHDLAGIAQEHDLRFRVYAAAPWPQGSRRIFESTSDWLGAFDEVRRRGVWFEIGVRYDLPACLEVVTSPEIGRITARVFKGLLPLYERVAGS